jgi:hypothetical protein
MMSRGSNEMERGQTKRRSAGGLRRLSFSFSFERSKAWAGCDGPWAVIFVLVGGFVMKMGYLFCWYLTKSLHICLDRRYKSQFLPNDAKV